ncbi:hydroxymethylbilane synthase [Actinomycetospora cinnamomea]|uniref:Porphobilinogen deaminase n=1 Tax=Actinomycetospora cinnamomea TaxID=663609 RepID=A0A2U1FD23_9PSEU|nr:hydroxymethylbilane synthase [Actinomycetospora cinnamomea]PVZ10087.1 hydroxymethylbilane synthase [Actinomycetospora cinnamomea]
MTAAPGTTDALTGAGARTIRIGTRASLLARTQTDIVASALTAAGATVEIVTISTSGDRSQAAGTPIAQTGVGVFVTALREALLADEIDVAVHSYKDLPTAGVPGLVLAAVPAREDPRDALVARDGMVLGELPPGAVVGTGSPRRITQIGALGLGLELVPIRGNVDTRIGKVTRGELDAVVLARAGLARLGRAGEVTEVLDPLQVLPAPAQGALACECRAADPAARSEAELSRQRQDAALAALLRDTLHDASVATAVTAERAVLAGLGSPCNAPVGALAEVVEDLDDDGRVVERLSLRAVAATADGALVRASATGETEDAERIGRELADELLADGAEPKGVAGDAAQPVRDAPHPPPAS